MAPTRHRCLTSGYICASLMSSKMLPLGGFLASPTKCWKVYQLKNHLFIHPFIEQILPWCLDLVLEHNARLRVSCWYFLLPEVLATITDESPHISETHGVDNLSPDTTIFSPEWPRDPRLDIRPHRHWCWGPASASALGSARGKRQVVMPSRWQQDDVTSAI